MKKCREYLREYGWSALYISAETISAISFLSGIVLLVCSTFHVLPNALYYAGRITVSAGFFGIIAIRMWGDILTGRIKL